MPETDRRRFFTGATLLAGVALVGCGHARGADDEKKKDDAHEGEGDEDIGVAEDLMREHGVLRRVLVVYDEVIRRLDASMDFPPESLARGAALIKRFVEDYHEKMEEEMIFPRFENAQKHVDLVKVLKTQHDAGRAITARVLATANAATLKDDAARKSLAADLRVFNHMYRPHAAREDTVLFPALHEILSPSEYDGLGEASEKREKEMFHGDGFDPALSEIVEIEKMLGIDDLASVTPKG